VHELTDIGAIQKNAYHAPVADTAAVVTIAAVANQFHVVDSIHFGFDVATDAAKNLLITFGGTTKFSIDIPLAVTNVGPHEMVFPRGLYTKTLNEAVVVTLSADGAGAIGKVNVTYR